jgi:tetratricopeptide (TPR) repeat protein
MTATLPSVLLACVMSLQQPVDLATYRQVIDAYRAGGVLQQGAVVLKAESLTIVSRAIDPASGWAAADFAAAAMFHTDMALRLVKVSGQEDAAAHVDAAAMLLRAALERDPDRAGFVRRWRIAVAAALYAAGARDLAARIGPEALPWLSESKAQTRARAAFARGLTDEIRAAVAGPLSGKLPKRSVPVTPEARRALLDAASQFHEALAADPADGEAALHVARIMIVVGRDIDADAPLRLAMASPDRSVRYLAMVFLGVIAERQSQYAEAERNYVGALEVFPWGQAAPLALSHVLMREGREAEARAAVARHFAETDGRVVEPLWTYLADPGTDPGPTLDLMRAEVWR